MTGKAIQHYPTFLFLLLLMTPKQSLLHHNMNVVLDIDVQQESSWKKRASDCRCDKDLATMAHSQQANSKPGHLTVAQPWYETLERLFVTSNLVSPEAGVTSEKKFF